ncbi:FAS1 domain-containing protein SELMODRAFT_448915-like [Phragmites australis]|uniref:FAS1 domain-containing protein SELMODRAFT_448915-like n=1 Tax=Phragmites australis TaxID=29695 RepID=UPI002D79CCE7|nr:FAS1 domain-containing protein SELMODRAFT_448915-like [Phragmites australis]
MASLLTATSLLVTLIMSTSNANAAASSPPAASSNIATTAQEMQLARYFTFVMLIRMVQEKIPRNTTFLMPNDRLLSTASIPENQVLEFLLRHSISAPLMFNDLIRLPNGTVVPTHHSSDMITVTSSGHQKLYLNNVELTTPDLCHSGDSFRCHGINGVIRPTAAVRRGKGATCTHYAAPTSAANQSLDTSSLPSPNTGSATVAAQEPAAESPQSSDTSIPQIGLTCTTFFIVLMFSIF